MTTTTRRREVQHVMAVEANKAVVRRLFEEGMNARRFDVFDELLAADYVNHSVPASSSGCGGFKEIVRMFVTAFPDMDIALEDVIGEGDLVATRGILTGTHRGPFMGIPASGRPVTVPYMDMWRVAKGKIVENWVQMDIRALMQQIGALPVPG